MTTKEEILEVIKGMSVLELSDLVKTLEEEFGISAAAPVAVAAPAAASPAEAAAAADEEQSEFDIMLQEIGPNKINVIKAVREVTSLGCGKPKSWWSPLRPRSKKGWPRTMPNRSRPSWKRPAPL